MNQMRLPGMPPTGIKSGGFAFENFWVKVYSRLKSKGITVERMAKKLGISRSKFYRLQYTENISIMTIIDMCFILEIDLSEFIYVVEVG